MHVANCRMPHIWPVASLLVLSLLLMGCDSPAHQAFPNDITLVDAQRTLLSDLAAFEEATEEGGPCDGDQMGDYAKWKFTDEDFVALRERLVRGNTSEAEQIRHADMEVAKIRELCPQAFGGTAPPTTEATPNPEAAAVVHCDELLDAEPWEDRTHKDGSMHFREYPGGIRIILRTYDEWHQGGRWRFDYTASARDENGIMREQNNPSWLRPLKFRGFADADHLKDYTDELWCKGGKVSAGVVLGVGGHVMMQSECTLPGRPLCLLGLPL